MSAARPLLVYIVAGEASGDRLGAALMAGLRASHDGPVAFRGVGGPLMAAQGLDSLFEMHELSLFGLLEVLPKWRALKARLRQCVADAASARPDVLVTIDSPGFTLRLAQALRPHLRVPFVHYVAPSVWAWRPGRAKKMARHVDHVLALLPFEPPLMQAAGMSCDFVGHPVVEDAPATPDEVAALRASIGAPDGARLVCLLPGSRVSEISRLTPVFLATARRLAVALPDLHFVLPLAAPHLAAPVAAAVAQGGVPVSVLPPGGEEQKRAAFAGSALALAASGTVSVELAAQGTPMVIGYRTNALTGWLMRRAALIDTVTLVNILTGTRTVPEYILGACTEDNLFAACHHLLTSPQAAQAQIAAGAQAMASLGKGGPPPGLRAARSVLECLSRHTGTPAANQA